MEEHPGGSEVILAATGKDATEDFEDTGHSDEAKELMGKYYIGKIDETTIPKKRSYDLSTTEKTYSSSTTSSSDPTRELIIKILKFLVPFMILGLAFTVRG
ncbi:putative cytochrome b5-like heme/steroid binding domain-containing protein [Helianthus annuus]|nr:putative cytochrome b5-like heme/steroid binding domain-containing protein [Helianthus annuus]